MTPTPHPIVVVGSLNLDLVVRVDHLPRPGETITAHSLQTFPGGKGANQAVAAARLGSPVVMIGKLGDDPAADQLRTALGIEGIDATAVETVPGPTGTALIHTDNDGQNSITVAPGANALLTPADIDRHAALIRNAAIVLTQLEIPLDTVRRLAELCAESAVPLILDPAPAAPLPRTLLRQLEWLTPNEAEAAVLCNAGNTQAHTGDEIIKHLRSEGARNILLKQGAHGAWVAPHDDPAFRSPAFPVTAVDTTAAGDCFNAAYAVALRRGDTLPAAARFSNAASALSITKPGAQPSLPTLAEVEAFLAKHVEHH